MVIFINKKYYSQRNLRRLGRTPVVMVESVESYRQRQYRRR